MRDKKQNILVSISCISFNHAPFIKQCLDGFLMQKTNFNFEILIHDDASTDGTVDIIKEYIDKYPDLIFPIFQKENQYSKGQRGFMAKFNFPRARGKYIALCEGDDYWIDPLKLQKQVDFLETNLEYSIVGNQSLRLTNEKIRSIEPDISNPILISQWIGKLPFRTNTFLFRNEIDFDKINFKKFISGDRIMMFANLMKGKGHIIKEYMSVYRDHQGGVSKTTNLVKVKLNEIDLYNEMNSQSKYHYNKKLRMGMFYNYDTILRTTFEAKAYFVGIKYFFTFLTKVQSTKELKTLVKAIYKP